MKAKRITSATLAARLRQERTRERWAVIRIVERYGKELADEIADHDLSRPYWLEAVFSGLVARIREERAGK